MLARKDIFVFLLSAVSMQGWSLNMFQSRNLFQCLPEPSSISSIGTTFYLFTKGGSNWKIVDANGDKPLEEVFDISRRTIFIVHGFTESKYTSWAVRMKDALLKQEDCNVILVDWSNGASRPYSKAVGNTQVVGYQIAELIRFLISSDVESPKPEFYIVGFSLGAQAAGYAGSYLKSKTEMTLSRITGLDPAGPCFSNVAVNYRLDKSDAEYVDVIHTNMGFLGTDKVTGHTDFYPNGGKYQPGCMNDLLKLGLLGVFTCNHMRATEYYIATVESAKDTQNCSWKAYPADLTCKGECPTMGYLADKTKRNGAFYLDTTDKDPSCGLN